jgi:galactokinase/mevalonate kinase-like predicted kinase
MQTVQAKVSYRIPLVGGITDYPGFYRKYGAQSICCSINKHLTVKITNNEYGGLRTDSKADLPWGIGLGSSGAFYSALYIRA